MKQVFFCTNCGNEFSKWAWQCSACWEWNTIKEMKQSPLSSKKVKTKISETFDLNSVSVSKERLTTSIQEFDRVLWGWIVPDSLILLTWDPWVWKSTLALQVALEISQNKNVFYFSGEESINQISDRSKRLSKNAKNFKIAAETSLENILVTLEKEENIDFVVIDSIQTIYSTSITWVSGSPMQVKYCADALMTYMKKRGVACLVIGHVTKWWEFSWPQTLAHLVDCVLYLEGDRYHQFRMLRWQKNRFGSTSEIGVFEMFEEWLKEVLNPSESFLEWRKENASWSIIIPVIEGTRPFLIELQALTSWTSFGNPKRTASWVDLNRLHLMIAVLQKYSNQKMDSLDVFVNIVWWMKVNEPAADLGLLMAIFSSKTKTSIPNDMVVIGEVWLTWEIRNVSNLEKRLKEAEKLGFKQAIVPYFKWDISTKLKLKKVKDIVEVMNFNF